MTKIIQLLEVLLVHESCNKNSDEIKIIRDTVGKNFCTYFINECIKYITQSIHL